MKNNMLDKKEWTKLDAIIAASEGIPVPDHVKHYFTYAKTTGRSSKRVKTDLKENKVPSRYNWNKPFYNKGGVKPI